MSLYLNRLMPPTIHLASSGEAARDAKSNGVAGRLQQTQQQQEEALAAQAAREAEASREVHGANRDLAALALSAATSQVGGYDTEIGGIYDEIEQRNAEADRLSAAQTELGGLELKDDDNNPNTESTVTVNVDTLSPEARAALGLKASDHGERTFRQTQVEGAKKSIGEQQKTISSSNELDMLTLQNAIQKRSEALKLASNLLNALHDTNKSITDNIHV